MPRGEGGEERVEVGALLLERAQRDTRPLRDIVRRHGQVPTLTAPELTRSVVDASREPKRTPAAPREAPAPAKRPSPSGRTESRTVALLLVTLTLLVLVAVALNRASRTET